MEFESKILSKNISELLYNSEKTLGTAESCTGGVFLISSFIRKSIASWISSSLSCLVRSMLFKILS